ncbi:MAG: hypothetical protein DHS20C14_21930 [Phycisphaeraceae bacterium]|nr:MAG: hypothetical protein DHS20C14_21930 [Phycisphaeraceae bacterium]
MIVAAALTTGAHAAPLSLNALAQQDLLEYEDLSPVRVGERVTLEDFPLDARRSVDLELERFSVLAPGAQTIIVDADGVEHDVSMEVVLLRGTANGDPDSRVFVSVSPYGTHGYVNTPLGLYAITSGPADPALTDDLGLRVANAAMIRQGKMRPPATCGSAEHLAETNATDLRDRAPEGYALLRPRTTALLETEIAVDTDYEYVSNRFGGDASAASAYIQTLIGGVSQIYEAELGVRLSLTYSRVFSSNNDPYPASPADDRLTHFRTEWQATKSSVDRDTAHMLTGTSPPSWGGRAYVSALCNNYSGYGVSAYINGWFPDPIANHQSGNWDLTVVAHELGHSHGTGHTHDTGWYNPPIDGCGSGNCSGAFGGTIMSYCHGCSGGMTNLVMEFDDRVKDNIAWYLDYYAPCVETVSIASCGSDCSNDGILNVDDIECFVTGFVVGSSAADCTGDGSLNVNDIECFITGFMSGCS